VRRKAAYLEFENDPELDFEFFLAEKLHMSVARLRREMGNDELMRWSVFFGRRAQDRELAERAAAQRR
jgi:hypothetical protein